MLAVFGIGAVALLERIPNGASTRSGTRDCRIVYVVDGDTVQVRCPARGAFRARLVGYDAPEVFSSECEEELQKGREATKALRALVERADDLAFAFGGTDEYGRRLLTLTADGRNVDRRMVEAGHGRRYGGEERPNWCR